MSDQSRSATLTVLLALLVLVVLPSVATAQWTATIRVEETAGIRRTSYPARTSFEVPPDRLPSAEMPPGWRPVTEDVGLYDGESRVPVQATALTVWPGGSIRQLELDFNVSLAPFEAKTLEFRYGAETPPDTAEARGLAVTEDATSVQSGRVRFGKSASPLLQSIAYRDEIVGVGRNGISITGRDGITYDGSEVDWISVEVMKAGPLVTHIRYVGELRIDGADVEVNVNVEMPSSKSWVDTRVTVQDAGARVLAVGLETPFALGPHPWSWDWATPNGTYGAFRDADASVVLTQRIDGPGEGSWQILTGPRGEERLFEASPAGRSEIVDLWGHLVAQSEAVAFALQGPGNTPGVLTASFDGSGQTTFRFEHLDPDGGHALRLYQHYVSTPVSIGAATSPASILAPLRVSIVP